MPLVTKHTQGDCKLVQYNCNGAIWVTLFYLPPLKLVAVSP